MQVLRRLRNYVEGLIEKQYGSRTENGSGRQASSIADATSSSYEPWERRWLDLEGEYTTVRRYLKASSGDEKEAMRRLEVSWMIEEELESGVADLRILAAIFCWTVHAAMAP